MERGFVGGLDLDDVASAMFTIFEDIFVALDDVQIVERDGLAVEAKSWVLTRAKEVVDHIADGGDAHGTKAVEGAGLHPKEFVGPDEIGLLCLGYFEKVAVEAVYARAGTEPVDDLADEGVAGLIVKGVEGDDGVAEPLQRPETVERGIIKRQTCCVKNFHRVFTRVLVA